jgi:hypothetical protein
MASIGIGVSEATQWVVEPQTTEERSDENIES